jgi:hypothetical protein
MVLKTQQQKGNKKEKLCSVVTFQEKKKKIQPHTKQQTKVYFSFRKKISFVFFFYLNIFKK